MICLPAVRSDLDLRGLPAAPQFPAVIAAAHLVSSGRELAAVGGAAATMTAGLAVAAALGWAAGAAMALAAFTAIPQAAATAPVRGQRRAKMI